MTRAVVALLGFVGGVACALGVALAIAIARAPAPAGPAVIRWRGGAVARSWRHWFAAELVEVVAALGEPPELLVDASAAAAIAAERMHR